MSELGEYDITPRPQRPRLHWTIRALAYLGLLEPDDEDWPVRDQLRVLVVFGLTTVATVLLTLFLSLGLPWLLGR